MYRPWGYYQSIDQGARYQVKRIVVRPGGRLSLQKHYHRAEHWIVVRGAAEVTLDGNEQLVHENKSIYLPIGSNHRLANPGKIDLELIEVQTGSYLGEDDIVRVRGRLQSSLIWRRPQRAPPPELALVALSLVPAMRGGRFRECLRGRCRCRAVHDRNSRRVPAQRSSRLVGRARSA